VADDVAGAVRRTLRPGRDDHAEMIVPVVQAGRGTTNTGGPGSPDHEAVSSRVSSRDREELDQALWRGRTLRGLADAASPETRRELIDTIIAAGWRPAPDVQWAWRLPERPDVVVPASEATARKQAELDPGTEVVRRPVGEWEVVSRG
jgi:hypothetical protein